MIELLKRASNTLLKTLSGIRRALLPNFHLENHPRLKRFIDRLISSSKSRVMRTRHGHTMYLDEADSLRLSFYGIYEEFETEFFLRELCAGDVVADVGANIGYYTLLFARAVGPSGHVFAFEPDPANFALLEKNVLANGYTNVTLVNKAVSNRSGALRLFLSDENKGDHRVYDSGDGRSCIEIEATSLDDYFRRREQMPNWIKMDIQGAEYHAVEGMRHLLASDTALTMVTEFWPVGLDRQGLHPLDFLKLLEDVGFTVYHIDEEHSAIDRADFQQLVSAFTPENERHSNLLCRKHTA